MTRTEVLEKYGRRLVTFTYYYKYRFTFSNEDIDIIIGGDADDIYRLMVDTGKVLVSKLMEQYPICVYEDDNIVYDERF